MNWRDTSWINPELKQPKYVSEWSKRQPWSAGADRVPSHTSRGEVALS